MEITLIRHGKTDFNVLGKMQGQTNFLLNEIGRQEMKKVKIKLVGKDFDIIFSSPLERAVESAQIIFPDRKIVTNNLLIQQDMGELEGVLFSEARKKFPNNKTVKYNNIEFLIPANGDTFEEIVKRCKDFLDLLQKKYKKNAKVAVVTHGTQVEILRAIIEEKPWHEYLGQVNTFSGLIKCIM
jgi:broad specificity phosphatase PhoE